jgi:hypothetical protein
VHVSPCYAYRGRAATRRAEAYGQRWPHELDEIHRALGSASNVIAFIAETVGGATAGAVPPVPGYLKGVREVCDRHGVLLILDEVMCGMGRCGTLHACEQEGVSPDIWSPSPRAWAPATSRSARCWRQRQRIVDAFRAARLLPARPHLPRPSGGLRGGAGRAAGDRTRRLLRERATAWRALRERGCARPSAIIRMSATSAAAAVPGIELVADRADKTPFDPALKLHARIKARRWRAA